MPKYILDRRQFVVGAGAFALGIRLLGSSRAAAAAGLSKVRGGDATPSLFVEIKSDGAVHLTCHRSEMGQKTWTAMAQLLADDLDADWSRIVIDQAEGHPKYGDQNTDGSRSVRRNFTRLRTAGAAMRSMLIAAAAKQWGVSSSSCHTEPGRVVHTKSKRTLGYGALAASANAQPIPDEKALRLKKRSEWRYIGKPAPSITTPLLVKGEGTFGIDVQLPGMLYAVIARPPQLYGRVTKLDDSKARAVAGVIATHRMPELSPPAGFKPLGGVAVIAKDTWSAIRGRRELVIDWRSGPNADYDSKKFAESMRETASKPGKVRRKIGDVDKALAAAKTRISADYHVPHLAHAPMEPPAATARWQGDSVECWACVQAPQSARKAVAEACGIPVESVTIHVTLLGGGFGRKSKPDFVAEAALIARAAKAPVKVTWTREDDLQHGYYHSVSAQHFEGGLDAQGACTAFLHRTVFPPIPSTFVAGLSEPSHGELRLGASDTPFAVPNLQLECGDAQAHVRIGWLRSVANIYHVFGVQSFAAELAHAAGRDQKDYLLELIGPDRHVDPNNEGAQYDNYGESLSEFPLDTARLRAVIEEVATMAKWGRALPKGHGLGIAAHRSFCSYVATVVEVSVDAKDTLRIVGVWSAMDAGTVVNPEHTRSQMEGGTLFGLSNALYGTITAKNGAIEQSNFPDWRAMRMNESPRTVEVKVMPSDAPPGGVGEPGTPPAAPALANAIFSATGQRIRTLPIFGSDDRGRRNLLQAKGRQP